MIYADLSNFCYSIKSDEQIILDYIRVVQVVASGWLGPTEFVRTKRLARLSSLGLRPSSVLSPQCGNQRIRKYCIFVAEMLLIVANVTRISTYAL